MAGKKGISTQEEKEEKKKGRMQVHKHFKKQDSCISCISSYIFASVTFSYYPKEYS